MDIEGNKIGGDFIAPGTPPNVVKFILAARAMMYSGPEDDPGKIIKGAITGSNNLVQGAAPVIAMVVSGLESKLGELPENELLVVATHLAGTVVEVAKAMGDPSVQDDDNAGRTTEELTDRAMELMSGAPEGQQEPQEGPEMAQGGPPMPQGVPMQPQAPQPLLASMGGQNA